MRGTRLALVGFMVTWLSVSGCGDEGCCPPEPGVEFLRFVEDSVVVALGDTVRLALEMGTYGVLGGEAGRVRVKAVDPKVAVQLRDSINVLEGDSVEVRTLAEGRTRLLAESVQNPSARDYIGVIVEGGER